MTEPAEALLRAATYLKWFRDRAITVDTEPPGDIGEIEQLASKHRQRASEDLELAEFSPATRSPDEPPDV